MSKKPLIELKAAQISYQGHLVLNKINLSIQQGEKIALVGKSGSGKSTLLHYIYDQLPKNSTLIPQDEGLVQTLSVYHNVYMGQLAQHASWYNLINLIRPFTSKVADIKEVLNRVQLDEKLFEPVANLSGGQRQRTAIARSLYQGGDLLLADEPISALDEHQSRLVLDALCNDFSTVILAMHDTQLARQYCDRIVGIQDGKVFFDKASTDLTDHELKQLYQGE